MTRPPRQPSAATSDPIAELIAALRAAGLRPNSRELAAALWLAERIDGVTPGWSAHSADAAPAQGAADKDALAGESDSTPVSDRASAPDGMSSPDKDDDGASKRDARTTAYPMTARTHIGGVSAAPVSLRDRPYLTQALHLGRAWRMLRRSRPSRREQALDLDATVAHLAEQHVARQGFWQPVHRPRAVPWLDLTLVIDRGPSMAVWGPLIDELTALLRRTGVFGRLRIRHLDPGPRLLEAGRVLADKAIGQPMPGAEPGHMLTLILTDGISATWYDPAMQQMLARLGTDGLAVMLQLMPASRWIDTFLGAGQELRLGVQRSARPGLPSLGPISAAFAADPGTAAAPVLPVISQTPWGVGALAALLRGGRSAATIIGYRLDDTEVGLAAASPYGQDATSEERLRGFLSVASPPARRLAGYLSRLPYPLSMRVMLVVQRAMQADDDLSALAEVFSGGLLEVHRAASAGQPASYRLIGQSADQSNPGPVIRDLGNLVSRDEAWTVLTQVTRELARTDGQPAADWPALIEDAADDAPFRLPERLTGADGWERALALIAIDVARRRGGAYLRGSARIAEALIRPPPKPATSAGDGDLKSRGPTPFRDRFRDGSGPGPDDEEAPAQRDEAPEAQTPQAETFEQQERFRDNMTEHSIMFEAISLFAELDADDIANIEAHTKVKRCRRNTVIIERGDDSSALYFIMSGQVRIYLAGDDGKEITLNELGPGDYFGELALVDETQCTASAMTLSDCELRTLNKAEFKQCLEQHPGIAFNLIRHLSLEVKRLSDELADMALLDVYGRVVKVLTDAAQQENGQLITPELTQQSITDRVGCSREMVNRILKELKLGGYLQVEDKRFVINRKLPARW